MMYTSAIDYESRLCYVYENQIRSRLAVSGRVGWTTKSPLPLSKHIRGCLFGPSDVKRDNPVSTCQCTPYMSTKDTDSEVAFTAICEQSLKRRAST